MDIILPAKTTITRESLAKTIKRETGLNINKASEAIDEILTFMISNIILENEINIKNFCTFSVKTKNRRVGRNPQSGVEVLIEARKVVKFKVAAKLKNMINANINLIS